MALLPVPPPSITWYGGFPTMALKFMLSLLFVFQNDLPRFTFSMKLAGLFFI